MASFRIMPSKTKPTTIRLPDELARRLRNYMVNKRIRNQNGAICMLLHEALPPGEEKEMDE